MKLKNQVCSLSLAKKLKKLGVRQESLYYWTKWDTFGGTAGACSLGKPSIRPKEELPRFKEYPPIASAFTASELGERLPRLLKIRDIGYWLQFEIKDSQGGWSCQYRNMGRRTIKFFEGKTMADAGAKMLIYLKENKLLKEK